MEWNDIISKRKNTYNWTNQTPDRSLIEKIVSEIHSFCPSKQRKIPFYIDIIDNKDYCHNLNLYNFLLDSKSIIQFKVINWLKNQVELRVGPFVNYKYDEKKCLRDIGFVISSFANDIKYHTNKYTIKMASGYWKDDIPQVRQYIECRVHLYLKEVIITLLKENNMNQYVHILEDRTTIVINAIEKGLDSLPKIVEGTDNLRLDIFYGTDRKGNGRADDLRNPQVLAPWLLAFSMRILDDVGLNIEMKDHNKARNVSENEIGIASMFAVLSATAMGLDTGFCACIRNGKEIGKRLGHRPGEDTLLYIGIGYGSFDRKYFNPIIHSELDIPNSDYDQKPNLETYLKFI
jgi:hypothetical protein